MEKSSRAKVATTSSEEGLVPSAFSNTAAKERLTPPKEARKGLRLRAGLTCRQAGRCLGSRRTGRGPASGGRRRLAAFRRCQTRSRLAAGTGQTGKGMWRGREGEKSENATDCPCTIRRRASIRLCSASRPYGSATARGGGRGVSVEGAACSRTDFTRQGLAFSICRSN